MCLNRSGPTTSSFLENTFIVRISLFIYIIERDELFSTIEKQLAEMMVKEWWKVN